MKNVVAIIVNYNSAGLTLDCLAALAPGFSAAEGCRVIVVDNCSASVDVETLRTGIADRSWSGWVEILAYERNGGFGWGLNRGMISALSGAQACDYFAFLNPDTIPREGAMEALHEFLADNPRVGVVGSRLEDPDGSGQQSRFPFPNLWKELSTGLRTSFLRHGLSRFVSNPPLTEDAIPIDWLAGASMMVRREAIADIGYFDERFFLYFEDADFCRRAWQAGWECWYVPASRVVHLVGGCTGVTTRNVEPRRVPAYWFEARSYYFRKHHGRLYTFVCDVLRLIGMAVWGVRRRLLRRARVDPPAFGRDLLLHCVKSVFGRKPSPPGTQPGETPKARGAGGAHGATPTKHRVAAVILNYRTAELSINALRSVVLDLGAEDVAAVVDNCSPDGAADGILDWLVERSDPRLRLLRSGHNGGFSAGNNVGVESINARHYLFLNSDTLLTEGAIDALVERAEEYSENGIVAPVLQYPDGERQVSWFRQMTPMTEFLRASGFGILAGWFSRHVVAPKEPLRDPDWVSFAAVLVRDDVLGSVGSLDPDYFMYYEDVDFCRRASRQSWRIVTCPEARVSHLRGQSSPVKARAAAGARLPGYYYESRATYFRRFYGRAGALAANILYVLGRLCASLRWVVGKRPRSMPRLAWLDVWRGAGRPAGSGTSVRRSQRRARGKTSGVQGRE